MEDGNVSLHQGLTTFSKAAAGNYGTPDILLIHHCKQCLVSRRKELKCVLYSHSLTFVKLLFLKRHTSHDRRGRGTVNH